MAFIICTHKHFSHFIRRGRHTFILVQQTIATNRCDFHFGRMKIPSAERMNFTNSLTDVWRYEKLVLCNIEQLMCAIMRSDIQCDLHCRMSQF